MTPNPTASNGSAAAFLRSRIKPNVKTCRTRDIDCQYALLNVGQRERSGIEVLEKARSMNAHVKGRRVVGEPKCESPGTNLVKIEHVEVGERLSPTVRRLPHHLHACFQLLEVGVGQHALRPAQSLRQAKAQLYFLSALERDRGLALPKLVTLFSFEAGNGRRVAVGAEEHVDRFSVAERDQDREGRRRPGRRRSSCSSPPRQYSAWPAPSPTAHPPHRSRARDSHCSAVAGSLLALATISIVGMSPRSGTVNCSCP